jgi:hypothetical protein
MNLAQPLDPAMRDPFQSAELGPGLINRVGRLLQRQFLTPSLGPVPRSRAWWG